MHTIDLNLEPVRGKMVLVALSGGADSVALLALLRKANVCKLAAAHFEHGIRGRESLLDADFCRALCAQWDIAFFEAQANVPEAARQRGQGLETVARELRYSFLRRVKAQIGADYIALAHHMDDQAETVLMHLLRGAGVGGMAGMRLLSGDLYRPLLGVRREELRKYLRDMQIPWREDATNAEAITRRNRLRLSVVPELQEIYPAAVPAIARQAILCADEDDCMRDLAADWMRKHVKNGPYGCRIRLEDAPHPAILRRVLRQAAARITGAELEFVQTEALLELAHSERGTLQLPSGYFAERTRTSLYVLTKRDAPQPVALRLPGVTRLEGICSLGAELWEEAPIRCNGPVQTLDRQALLGAELRTRRAGDRIHPFGMRGDKLLSDYLTDRGVERPLRDSLPLVARGGRVLWVVGIGIADEAALRPGAEGIYLEASLDTY